MPRTVPGPKRWCRPAVLLLGLVAIGGCGREPGTEDPAASGTADSAQSTNATQDVGLPISASISADSPSSAAAPSGEAAAATPNADAAEAARVVEDYYAAIDAGDYERAFGYWGDSGRASGQSYLQFVAGFAETAGVAVAVGDAGRVEGAAGSRYVEVPVVVTATTKAGREQRYQGTYTLRRTVVDGATPEQRRWHLHDAELRELR